MDRKMDKYIKLEDAIDLFWTVDPENNGDDGCTVVLKCGSYDSNEIETLLSELPTIEIAPPNEPLTQAELNEMYLNEVWLEYPDGSGETAIVVLGTIYSVNALEGAGLDWQTISRAKHWIALLGRTRYTAARRRVAKKPPPKGGRMVMF